MNRDNEQTLECEHCANIYTASYGRWVERAGNAEVWLCWSCADALKLKETRVKVSA